MESASHSKQPPNVPRLPSLPQRPTLPPRPIQSPTQGLQQHPAPTPLIPSPTAASSQPVVPPVASHSGLLSAPAVRIPTPPRPTPVARTMPTPPPKPPLFTPTQEENQIPQRVDDADEIFVHPSEYDSVVTPPHPSEYDDSLGYGFPSEPQGITNTPVATSEPPAPYGPGYYAPTPSPATTLASRSPAGSSYSSLVEGGIRNGQRRAKKPKKKFGVELMAVITILFATFILVFSIPMLINYARGNDFSSALGFLGMSLILLSAAWQVALPMWGTTLAYAKWGVRRSILTINRVLLFIITIAAVPGFALYLSLSSILRTGTEVSGTQALIIAGVAGLIALPLQIFTISRAAKNGAMNPDNALEEEEEGDIIMENAYSSKNERFNNSPPKERKQWLEILAIINLPAFIMGILFLNPWRLDSGSLFTTVVSLGSIPVWMIFSWWLAKTYTKYGARNSLWVLNKILLIVHTFIACVILSLASFMIVGENINTTDTDESLDAVITAFFITMCIITPLFYILQSRSKRKALERREEIAVGIS